MTNKELKDILATMPDDTEIGIGVWCNPLLKVAERDVSINFVDCKFIKFYDDQDDLEEDEFHLIN